MKSSGPDAFLLLSSLIALTISSLVGDSRLTSKWSDFSRMSGRYVGSSVFLTF